MLRITHHGNRGIVGHVQPLMAVNRPGIGICRLPPAKVRIAGRRLPRARRRHPHAPRHLPHVRGRRFPLRDQSRRYSHFLPERRPACDRRAEAVFPASSVPARPPQPALLANAPVRASIVPSTPKHGPHRPPPRESAAPQTIRPPRHSIRHAAAVPSALQPGRRSLPSSCR